MNSTNTIAAISTAYGRSGIGIIRVSGDNVLKIINVFIQKNLLPRVATNTLIYDVNNEPIDDVIAIYYKSPSSYTGEDMLEIQCHGNPIILDNILSMYFLYSSRVVAPIVRSSPRASWGLSMLEASTAPSLAPAPTMV